MNFLKKNKMNILAGVCLTLFILLTFMIVTQNITILDIKGYAYISQYLISDKLTPFVKFITNFGGARYFIILTILLVVLVKDKKMKIYIPMNLLLISSLNAIFKNILQRPRPVGFRLVEVSGYSFPSGHSMVSMAFYGFLIYLVYKKMENQYIKWFLVVLLSCLIVCIGISRIYLGVHYTTDVLAGFSFSLMYLMILTRFIQNRFDAQENHV